MNASVYHLYKVMYVVCPVMAEKPVTVREKKAFSKLCPVLPAEFKKVLGD